MMIKDINVSQPYQLRPAQVEETLSLKILSQLSVDKDKKMPKYNSFANIQDFERMANISHNIKTEKQLIDYASSILDTEVQNMSQIESEVIWEERKSESYISEDTVTYQRSFDYVPTCKAEEAKEIARYIEKKMTLIN